MIYTVEILNEHALNLLRELERLKIIRLRQVNNGSDVQTQARLKEFKAVQIDTQGFKFNRDEANER